MDNPLLARYAECIFWLARSVERAENLARIIEVNQTFSRDRSGSHNWLSIVQLNTDEKAFFAKHAQASAENVIRFYLTDADNPTSIVSAVTNAREAAWALFGNVPPGWQRVQSICDFVHGHIRFGYEHARPTKSAWDAYMERTGVCRDFAHLAVTLCRCMNIPARYCTGYLGDIGVPVSAAPMDFSGWLEAYLGDRWYTFDARHNCPRIARIVMARGRDATDVAISTTFGNCLLTGFTVITDKLPEDFVPSIQH